MCRIGEIHHSHEKCERGPIYHVISRCIGDRALLITVDICGRRSYQSKPFSNCTKRWSSTEIHICVVELCGGVLISTIEIDKLLLQYYPVPIVGYLERA